MKGLKQRNRETQTQRRGKTLERLKHQFKQGLKPNKEVLAGNSVMIPLTDRDRTRIELEIIKLEERI